MKLQIAIVNMIRMPIVWFTLLFCGYVHMDGAETREELDVIEKMEVKCNIITPIFQIFAVFTYYIYQTIEAILGIIVLIFWCEYRNIQRNNIEIRIIQSKSNYILMANNT